MTLTTTPALIARMLRTRPAASALVALLTLLLAAIAAAVPITLTAVTDAQLRTALAELSPGSRDVQTTALGLPEPGAPGAEWDDWNARLHAIGEVGAPLAPLLGAPSTVAWLPFDAPVASSGPTDRVLFAIDPDNTEKLRLVEGRWPEPSVPQDDGWFLPVEVVLPVATAEAFGIGLGTITLPESFGSISTTIIEATVTGLYEPAPGHEDDAYHVPQLYGPTLTSTPTGDPIVTGHGFVAPAMLAQLYGDGGQTQVWFPFDPAGVVASDADELLRQLRLLTTQSHPMASETAHPVFVKTLSLRTTSIEVLETTLAAGSALRSLIALTLAAPAGVALVVIALACRLVARTRRPALALLATRGASPGLLRGMLAAHGAAFGLVPGLVGAGAVVTIAALAGFAVPPAAPLAAAAAALVPVVVLGGMAPPPAGLREQVTATASPRARLLTEGVVIAATLLATAALVTQALSGARLGTLAAPGGAGVLAASVPLLWGIAGCLVALRIVPLVLRDWHGRARRGRDLTAFLGTTRALRERAGGIAPALALVIGMASAVSSGVLYGSIQHDLQTTAAHTVGADVQVAQARLSADDLAALQAIPGVTAVAEIATLGPLTLRAGAESVTVIALFADPARLAAVGHPDAALLEGAGTPIVVSPRVAGVAGDDAVTVSGAATTLAGVSDAAPPAGVGSAWVLLDAADEPKLGVGRAADVSVALIALAPGADDAAVAAAVREIVGAEAAVRTPAMLVAERTADPGTAAVRAALLGTVVAVAVLAGLAVVLTLALGSRARERILALARMLGAPARAGRGLIVWELGPPLVAAVVVGLGVGLALPALLLATVDLSAFTGSGENPAYHLDPGLLALAVGGFLLLAAALTTLALLLSRRARLAVLLRAGQEG